MLLVVILASCNKQAKTTEVQKARTEFTEKLRFNESTYLYDGGILIANFGGEQMNPLNTDGKGYVVYLKNDSITDFIPADGSLNAPKGMYIFENHLFISDVGRVVVYDLNNKAAKPQFINFPKQDLFVNDLVANGKALFASVTNTGNIYKIDLSDVANVSKKVIVKFANVPGANGLTFDGNKMYVASYPAVTGKTSAENVVYVFNDINSPKYVKLMSQSGQYDDIALSSDKNTLYVSNWDPVEILGINLSDKSVNKVINDLTIKSIADFTVEGNKIYIPDLVSSRLFIKEIK